jgi:hypothetical protein
LPENDPKTLPENISLPLLQKTLKYKRVLIINGTLITRRRLTTKLIVIHCFRFVKKIKTDAACREQFFFPKRLPFYRKIFRKTKGFPASCGAAETYG